MGGSAFSLPGHDGPSLHVPRMPQEVYNKVKSHCHAILRTFFDTVVTPAEAPEKLDYGDVDFLVSNADNHNADRLQLLPKALTSKRTCYASETVSLAIPWAEILGNEQLRTTGDKADLVSQSLQPHVQVDVHLCPNDSLTWMEFKRAWGDFWQILGVMIRPLGLTGNDQGFYVRIEAIEPSSKKGSMLFLTSNPHETLDFLGMSAKRYLKGFETEQELFDYCRQSRLFVGFHMERRPENSSDRQRMKKRPMYRRFVQKILDQTEAEWSRCASPKIDAGTQILDNAISDAHKCPSLKDYNASTTLSRQSILQECLKHFQKQKAFDGMMKAFQMEAEEKSFWRQVNTTISANEKDTNLAIRSLKKRVYFCDGFPVLLSNEDGADHQTGGWLAQSNLPEPELLAWVENHWQEALKQ